MENSTWGKFTKNNFSIWLFRRGTSLKCLKKLWTDKCWVKLKHLKQIVHEMSARCIGNVTVRRDKMRTGSAKKEIMHLAKVSKFLGRFVWNSGWEIYAGYSQQKSKFAPQNYPARVISTEKQRNLRERLIFRFPVHFFYIIDLSVRVQVLLTKREALKFIDFYSASNISLSKKK